MGHVWECVCVYALSGCSRVYCCPCVCILNQLGTCSQVVWGLKTTNIILSNTYQTVDFHNCLLVSVNYIQTLGVKDVQLHGEWKEPKPIRKDHHNYILVIKHQLIGVD